MSLYFVVYDNIAEIVILQIYFMNCENFMLKSIDNWPHIHDVFHLNLYRIVAGYHHQCSFCTPIFLPWYFNGCVCWWVEAPENFTCWHFNNFQFIGSCFSKSFNCIHTLSHRLHNHNYRMKKSVLLGRAWASPTLVWLHSACACVCMYVCMYVCLQPYTKNFKWAHLNFNITKINLGVCSVVYLEMRYTPCLLQIVDGRLPTGNTNSITMMVEVASGNIHA